MNDKEMKHVDELDDLYNDDLYYGGDDLFPVDENGEPIYDDVIIPDDYLEDKRKYFLNPDEFEDIDIEELGSNESGKHRKLDSFIDKDIIDGILEKSRNNKNDGETRVVATQKSRKGPVIFLCVLLGVLLFSGVYCMNWFFGSYSDDLTKSKSKSELVEEAKNDAGYSLEEATGAKLTISQINDKVGASIVEITTEYVEYGGYGIGNYIAAGAGSGVIFKENGYIITSKHVIEGAKSIVVTVADKPYKAQVVGVDMKNDIAVLKIDAKGLTAATFGNSDNIKVGDLAVVIGNPLGELGGSVTQGIISCRERDILVEDQKMKVIQTDASINPGNSGGGLFNDEGQLIGIIEAKSSGMDIEGLGFAIPINVAAESADNIMKTGGDGNGDTGDVAFTGMSYREITTEAEAKGFGVKDKGVYVVQILTKNASKAGFIIGDKVVKFDGKKIKSFEDYQNLIMKYKPEDTVDVEVERDGETVTLRLTLGSKFEYEKQNGGYSEGYSDDFNVYDDELDDMYKDIFGE